MLRFAANRGTGNKHDPVARSIHALIRRILLLFAMLQVGAANAMQYCVADHDQLRAALTSATANAEDDEIRIRATDIHTPFQSTVAFGATMNDLYDLDISGGWGTSCFSQSLDPGATRIVASVNQTIQLLNVSLGVDAQGTFRLSNLSLVGGKTIERGGCLYITSSNGSLANVVIDRSAFLGCRAVHGGAAEIDMAGGKVTFRGNLIQYNQTTNGSGAILLGNGIGDAYLHNNTFLDNSVVAGNIRDLQVYGGDLFFIYNNIFDSTLLDADDVNVQVTSNTALVRNIYRARGGTPAAGSTGNLVGVDPQFAKGDVFPRLGANSPARNSGTNSLLGGLTSHDLAGLPRVMEGTVDRGAYEFQALFGNSFE